MCIGFPMRIERIDGDRAHCVADGIVETVDVALLPEAAAGDWVLVFLGSARRVLDAAEAALIGDALGAVRAAMEGRGDDDAFADLTGREPTLPPHLQAAHAAGLTEG
ncbi:HypC/HybG/HupF family hydrogenase formation chaperone [Azospirillum sp. RWY-5-1]|uniref:HypC/HybG/HupF family hydrogenase formation chaperone n=1 Tax=Azospirillum oleiclasticum TaxID=2735135 RepID=A0ABX2T909_9PROT|nr:HypC/HybG/HupF family hydrogenase formation chaperone [Azospirillum oleiclasticum]NYZ19623.1 HypC/HybG/HupF family hydrogenase formation chaperone [Azospirillum oleiclasticum]